MNVTFHTLVSLATMDVISPRLKADDLPQSFARQDLSLLAAGFTVGVLTHGLLDYVPHAYPLKSSIDVLVSLTLFCVALFMVRRRQWLLLGTCFAGCIFPDLVDLGPAIVNKRLGWSLSVVKVFPWHWRAYSGSVYDGSRNVESFVYHMIVAGGSLVLLYANRSQLLRRPARDGAKSEG